LTCLRQLPLIFCTKERSSSPLESFLRHGAELSATTTAASSTPSAAYVNISEVAPARFSDRLTLVINAILQLCQARHGTLFYGDNPAVSTNMSAEYGYDFGHLRAANNDSAQLRRIVENEGCGRMCSCSTRVGLGSGRAGFDPWLTHPARVVELFD
jgi:hypothetical protein